MDSWLLLSLLTAHVVGDFYLQTDRYCKNKEDLKLRSPFLYVHSVIVGLAAWALVPQEGFAIWALAIAATHFLTDTAKAYIGNSLPAFLADQAAHIAVLIAVASVYTPEATLPLQHTAAGGNPRLPLFAFALLCCLKPTNILIKLVLKRYSIMQDAAQSQTIKVGALIGNLERILALALIMAGQYEAVGFIVAAKSILRFKDTDTQKTEYVLAGTLLSLGTATICGLAAATAATLL